MKRVLLIIPPFYRLMGSHYNGIHLGMAYMAAVLKQHGHQVAIYNADYLDSQEYADQRVLFDNSTSYKVVLNNPDDPIWAEIEEKIVEFPPDIIGISMLTANWKAAQNIAKIGKATRPDTTIVIGGAHPTLDPEGSLACSEFDCAIRGEGEFALLELADERSEEDILGLSWRKNGGVVHNEDRPFIANLDELPFPERDSYLNSTKHMEVGYIATGRGCPFSCAFCASPRIWRRTTRFRSIQSLLMELRHLKDNYKTQVIRFTDDTFDLDQSRAKEICRQIIDSDLNMEWTCDARADLLDGELLALMKEAGCIRIKVGVESGSDKILRQIEKGVTKDKIRHAVALIKEAGIPLTIYLMVGFPNETTEDLQETIELAREVNADYYSVSILAPYYGTEIWRSLQESDTIIDREHWEYFYHQSKDMLVNKELNPRMVDEFFALNDKEGRSRL